MRDVPIPVDLDTHIVPVVWPDDRLQLRGRPHDPPLAVPVDTACVVTDRAVDLDLSALDDFRCSGLKRCVNVDTAVATRLTLESQTEIEVPIRLLGREVAVFVGDTLTVDGAIVDNPLLISDLLPTGEILAVKKRFPLWAERFLGGDGRGG